MGKLWELFSGIYITVTLWTHTTLIVAVQLLSVFLKPFSKTTYYRFHAHIMRQWSQVLFFIMKTFAPGELIITFDDSCLDEDIIPEDEDEDINLLETILTRNNKGEVTGISFPDRLIMVANHQIYADWIYIWFLAYKAKAHGALKIMLKYSLSRIPIFGLGMKFFEFIFLKRKLEQDKDTIIENLKTSKIRNRPMWLVLFPEGTVISDYTRSKSKQYADKLQIDDLKFCLLPRSTGFSLCRETLGDSIEWVYDLTIGYPGIEPGQNPEDVMTMKRIFCEGTGPKQIHIFIRRYRVKTLPKDNPGFNEWLLNVWKEKDKRLIYFNDHDRFEEESEDLAHLDIEDQPLLLDVNQCRTIRAPIQLEHTIRECFGYLLYLLFYIPFLCIIIVGIHVVYIQYSN
ncbi:acyltransferase-domain-containing protein [Pilobolus umbonatus]|nr:acyltransferase-domain-containing protein [Pilobolus umbonatus]